MSAPRTPLPKVGYKRQHEGSWLLLRDGMRIGRIDRDLETQALSVMVDNLYWNIEGTKLQAHGGMAVKTFNKRMGLKLICIHVAFALREMEASGEVQPATIAPRDKPTITIDLEPQPRAVTVTTLEDRSAMVTVEGLCNLPLSESEARALWVLLGNHLCEPAGPGLDRRAAPVDHWQVRKARDLDARTALSAGLKAMWVQTFKTDPTQADMNAMADAMSKGLKL